MDNRTREAMVALSFAVDADKAGRESGASMVPLLADDVVEAWRNMERETIERVNESRRVKCRCDGSGSYHGPAVCSCGCGAEGGDSGTALAWNTCPATTHGPEVSPV